MVQRFPPALSGSYRDAQVFFNAVLPGEFIKATRTQTGIQGRVFCIRFA